MFGQKSNVSLVFDFMETDLEVSHISPYELVDLDGISLTKDKQKKKKINRIYHQSLIQTREIPTQG